MEPQYSIIIPHKNIPKLLQRCLDSIPQRDDLEIIIVDDNSDPEIVDFDKFPGKEKLNTIIVFDKTGKGAGHARNVGIRNAKGKKVLFADADDYFNYCIRDILDDYKNDNNDIVFFKASSIDSDSYLMSGRNWYLNKLIDLYAQNPHLAISKLKYYFGAPWCKLIKKDIIDKYGLEFDETSIHNDVRFSYTLGSHVDSSAVDTRALYCVTYRDSSISYQLTDEKILDRISVQTKRDKFLKSIGMDFNEIDIHIRTMLDLYDKKRMDLFNHCMEIFQKNGFSKEFVQNRMKKLRRQDKIAKCKSKVKGSLYYFIHKIL